MKKMNWMRNIAMGLALTMGVSAMAGCGEVASADGISYTPGGVLTLSVNPEVAVFYDGNGDVVSVEARNDDGRKILDGYDGYKGLETQQVVSDLVNEIGKAGYFVTDIEDGTQERKISIGIEPGSTLPSDTFLDDVVAETQKQVEQSQWNSSVQVLDYAPEDYIYGETVDYIDDDDIEVFYESNGKVTMVVSGDDNKIERVYEGFVGSDVRETVLKLIDKVEAANYYVEEVENTGHRIEIEIESAANLPTGISAKALNETARSQVKQANWNGDRLVIDYDAEDYLGMDLDNNADDLDDLDDDDDLDDADDLHDKGDLDDDDLDDDADDVDDLDDDKEPDDDKDDLDDKDDDDTEDLDEDDD